MLRCLIGIILREIICESSNWQHIQRLKITILGANWQLFRLERIAKCSCFILYTQNINFYWFVMKIKKFLLPIWWDNRGLFPLGNKYFGVFVLNGLHCLVRPKKIKCYVALTRPKLKNWVKLVGIVFSDHLHHLFFLRHRERVEPFLKKKN